MTQKTDGKKQKMSFSHTRRFKVIKKNKHKEQLMQNPGHLPLFLKKRHTLGLIWCKTELSSRTPKS